MFWYRNCVHNRCYMLGFTSSSLTARLHVPFLSKWNCFLNSDRDLSLSGAEYDIMGSIRKLYFVEREEVPVGEVEREVRSIDLLKNKYGSN